LPPAIQVVLFVKVPHSVQLQFPANFSAKRMVLLVPSWNVAGILGVLLLHVPEAVLVGSNPSGFSMLGVKGDEEAKGVGYGYPKAR
jgi:hypothetical protein